MKWESYAAWNIAAPGYSFDQLYDIYSSAYPIQNFTFFSKGFYMPTEMLAHDDGPDDFYLAKDALAVLNYEGPYKYHLEYSMSTDEDGNSTISAINLIEEEIPFKMASMRTVEMPSDSSRIFPTANEFRPVNIAVKYFIRAR